ncbi:MAG: hypothetical protein RIC52_06595 [Amphiplicatus sp.]
MHLFELLVVLLAIDLILIAGCAPLTTRLKKNIEKRAFLFDFREAYIEWLNSRCSRQDLYQRLIAHSPIAQHHLGQYGLMDYQAPFGRYAARNWPIIMNAIPMINHEINDFILDRQGAHHASMVDEALLRGLGAADFDRNILENRIKNPLHLFVSGVEWILSIPLLVLAEFGLLNARILNWFRNSAIIKLVSLGVVLIGAISGIMTIILGWEEFQSMMSNWITQVVR